MLYQLTMALLLPFVDTPDAKAAAFWLQHYAHTPLSPAELARSFWRG